MKFDEKVISDLHQFRSKLATMKSKLTELGLKALNIFQVNLASIKKKSRSKMQNKHRAAEHKARHASQRTSEVLQKIALTLEEDTICEKSEIDKVCVKNPTKEKENG